jgi:hypothetical protein
MDGWQGPCEDSGLTKPFGDGGGGGGGGGGGLGHEAGHTVRQDN